MNSYEARLQARKERLQKLAEKTAKKADESYTRGREILDLIPLGQPILVDHYSARAFRAKKEKAIKSVEKGFALQKQAKAYKERAEGVGTGGVSQDDPDAIVKLKEKLVKLEEEREAMKSLNKKARANSEEKLPSFYLGNIGANIRSTQKRIALLEKMAQRTEQPDIHGNGYTFRESVEDNRLQFIFTGKPSEETRATLKKYGYRWSPTNGAWQAYRSPNGRYGARHIIAYLDTIGAKC